MPVVHVEGLIAHNKVDPDGDQFDLDGVSYDGYLDDGYVANCCDVRPKINDLIGEPVSIKRTEDGLLMRAKILNQPMVGQLQALAAAGLDPELGFAMAGVATKTSAVPGGRVKIEKFMLRYVALIHGGDPAYRVRIVKPVIYTDGAMDKPVGSLHREGVGRAPAEEAVLGCPPRPATPARRLARSFGNVGAVQALQAPRLLPAHGRGHR
jgi:hypothetical protein